MYKFITITSCAFLAACSTVIEEQISEEYDPVYPVEVSRQADLLPTGSIYGGTGKGLFAMDRRATQVGDILTVQFRERFAASKSQSANSAKSDEFGLSLPTALSSLTDDIFQSGTEQSFSGNGAASQSNSLTGRMSVSVVRVLPGGNLEIVGQKKLTLNNGDEYIRLRGVVRPADISADNIIESDRIAHADIKYIGAGQIADTAKQGWLRQAVTTISPN